MKTDLPADQQFFADLFSGLVLNPHRLGRVWFASQPLSLPSGSLCIDLPGWISSCAENTVINWKKTQRRLTEGEMLFIPARAANGG